MAPSTRPEYAKLADDLPELARQFGWQPPAHILRDVREFTLALDCIDQELDAMSDPEARRRFGLDVLRCLSGDEPAAVRREGLDRVERLSGILAARGLSALFCRLARAALDNSERMRLTRDPAAYLACVEREGRLTVELTVLLLGEEASPGLVRFLRAVAEIGNLVDKLVDARRDHWRGELALRPGLRVHARLTIALVRRIPRALSCHPQRGQVVAWGVGWIAALFAQVAAQKST